MSAVVALFALLTLVPLVPWRARCYEVPVPGPYRPIFVDEVAAWLAQENVYYWRINDLILPRVLPLFDGNEVFDRRDVLLNINKISYSLEEDYTLNGVLYPKPPAVREVERQPPGTWDGIDRCRAAIQLSPADPPVP